MKIYNNIFGSLNLVRPSPSWACPRAHRKNVAVPTAYTTCFINAVTAVGGRINVLLQQSDPVSRRTKQNQLSGLVLLACLSPNRVVELTEAVIGFGSFVVDLGLLGKASGRTQKVQSRVWLDTARLVLAFRWRNEQSNVLRAWPPCSEPLSWMNLYSPVVSVLKHVRSR